MLAHPSIESTRPGPAASRYQYQLILPAHTVLHCLLTYLDDDSSRPETVELKSDGSQATALPCTFRRTTRANVIPAMPCALLVSARLSPEEQVITNSSSVLQYSIAVQIIVLLHGVRGHAAQRSSKSRRSCHCHHLSKAPSDVHANVVPGVVQCSCCGRGVSSHRKGPRKEGMIEL